MFENVISKKRLLFLRIPKFIYQILVKVYIFKDTDRKQDFKHIFVIEIITEING